MPRKSAAALATPTIFDTKRPPPPAGLPQDAAALWVSICAGLDANYFSTGDLVLLEALVMADHHKRLCDALVLRDGPILADGSVNNAAKLSNQYAATMAALSGKLRLCKSATTRPESAGLKKALHSGLKPWESDPEMAEYFS
ncbi:hypothetical protein PY257_06760 [Ramlibacter sp. H39-3-26]|uniref:hypothetical protein n=1 Tax=Curvibacter soli TaxID=3031331 RepID=UPI0023DCD547|nr:hypothetical protein [Ramlibacter sp. H39-3-26]MDF1484889.1 hypothetical protein [Ramlibacter sp. H39-3-26]